MRRQELSYHAPSFLSTAFLFLLVSPRIRPVRPILRRQILIYHELLPPSTPFLVT
ncbi:hypothetical protein HMPREF9374_3065 [Desmospora sp. 8437]|nr:hypothetical protein HMPREF9374_3065 [Desmospora sp. 8437]